MSVENVVAPVTVHLTPAQKAAKLRGVAPKAAKPQAGALPSSVAKRVRKPSPKPVVKKEAPKEASKQAKGAMTKVCSFCGKPLSRHSSVEAGMGDVCNSKHKLLPAGMTIENYRSGLTEVDVPDGWIKLKEAIAKAKTKGVSGYRFLQACGGDRMLRKPLNKVFKVIYVDGARYIDSDCLKHLAELKKV
jgi:hypothetical protein